MYHGHYSFSGRGGRSHRRFGGPGGFFGGPFGGGFGGGHGMRGKMLGSADLQLIILQLLREKPRHGYEIIKAIEEHSSGIYAPSPGMVYPALTYLEEMGYASAAAEGTKKLYNITSDGAAYLEQHQSQAQEVWNRLALVGRKLARFQQQFAEEEDVADHFGSDPRGRARAEWHHMKAEFGAVRDELKAALYQKMDSSLEEKQRILAILRRAIAEIRGK